jgi:hypothetical protein
MLALLLLCLGAEPSRLEAAWADLAGDDAAKVARATLTLAADKAAVKFLETRLRAVKADPKRVAKLIEQLDAEEFNDRKQAKEELAYLGKFAKDEMRKAMDATKSLEVKARLKELLATADPPNPRALLARGISVSSFNGNVSINGVPLEKLAEQMAPPKPPAAWVRAARAAAVLEHIGSAEARALLEKLGDGEAEAPPTKAARESLGRLKK